MNQGLAPLWHQCQPCQGRGLLSEICRARAQPAISCCNIPSNKYRYLSNSRYKTSWFCEVLVYISWIIHERLYLLSDNFACLSVCQWLCACYRLETGWCIDEAGLPIHYHQCLGSTIPATFLHRSHAPLSTNPRNLRSATGGKLYTCTLDTEKNCIQAPGHLRWLSISTHTSGPGREGDMGHGTR